jgi:hypothetical protein
LVYGRTSALVADVFLAAAAVGHTPPALVGGRFKPAGRFAFFIFDMTMICAMLAFAPLGSGGGSVSHLAAILDA